MHHELKRKINPRKMETNQDLGPSPILGSWNAYGVVGVCRIFPIPKASA